MERIPLTPPRDVRCIEGTLQEILKGPRPGENRQDYLMVTLLDREPIRDAMGKLRSVYPNVLHIQRPHLNVGGELSLSGDHRRMDHLQLFQSFFTQVTGEPPSQEQSQAYASVVEELQRRQREAHP